MEYKYAADSNHPQYDFIRSDINSHTLLKSHKAHSR